MPFSCEGYSSLHILAKAFAAAYALNTTCSRCFAAGVCRFTEFTFWVSSLFTFAFPLGCKSPHFCWVCDTDRAFFKLVPSRRDLRDWICFPLFPSVLEIAQRLWWGSVNVRWGFRTSLSLSLALVFAFVYSRSAGFQDVVSCTSEGGKSGIGKDRQLMKNIHSTRKVWRGPDANENPC